MHAVGDTGTSPVPAFLSKLWTLVEDPSTDEFICWDVSGKSFHVFDQGRFSKEVLPLYFKHSNIASFIRQLNMYGFRKVVGVESGGLKVEKDDMEFAHQYFQRGNESLLEHIKRKRGMSSQVPSVKTDEMKIRQDDVQRVLNDVRAMKGKQDSVTNKLEGIKRENELLWLEVASLRQKHMKQQQIVNKLIHFLMSLVGNRGVDRKRKMPLMLNDASQLEAAKLQKFSPHFTIESGVKGYKVTSPEAQGSVDEGLGSSTLSIHEVTDQIASGLLGINTSATTETTPAAYSATATTLPTASTSTLGTTTLPQTDDDTDILEALVAQAAVPTLEEMPTSLEVGEPSTEPIFTLPTDVLPLEDLASSSTLMSDQSHNYKVEAPLTASTSSPAEVSDPVLGSGAVVPASRPTNPKVLNREMSDHIDTLQNDLDSLKELLSGGQYTFEPSTIMGMFELGSLMSDQQPSTSSADSNFIVGNEVVQYNPPDDISSLFDLGDLSSSTPLDQEDDLLNNPSALSTPFVEAKDDLHDTSALNTPFVVTDDEGPRLLAPSTTTSTEEVD